MTDKEILNNMTERDCPLPIINIKNKDIKKLNKILEQQINDLVINGECFTIIRKVDNV